MYDGYDGKVKNLVNVGFLRRFSKHDNKEKDVILEKQTFITQLLIRV